jgi:hypothetical protein
MRSPREIAPGLLAALVALAWQASALAQSRSRDKALATTLFNEGRALLAEGKVPEACRKFEESQRLDPLLGTLLNLATCHEREGLAASAWTEFREARSRAIVANREDRVTYAEEHIKALEPRVSKLVVVVDALSSTPGLQVLQDGADLGRAAWSTPIPVDPGEHVVEASAPTKSSSRTVVQVGAEGDVQTVVLSALEDAPPPPPAGGDAIPWKAPEAQPPSRLSTRRTIALVTAGVGIVALGAGTYFGIRAISEHHDPAAACTVTPCSKESITKNDEAKRTADFSTASFIVGLATLGVGAFLWFGESHSSAPRASVTVAPRLGPTRTGADLSIAF